MCSIESSGSVTLRPRSQLERCGGVNQAPPCRGSGHATWRASRSDHHNCRHEIAFEATRSSAPAAPEQPYVARGVVWSERAQVVKARTGEMPGFRAT